MARNDKINSCEFYVSGMHCAACEMLIEKKLSKHENVQNVKANLNAQNVSIELINGDYNGETDIDRLRRELTSLIEESGYKLLTTKVQMVKINYKELAITFLISLFFIGSFLLIQKLGIVKVLTSDKVTLPFVFLIGIVASLSTCMAVVGGLVLSLSSTLSKYSSKSLPLITFHTSRIISFFILGGIIGLLGATFTLSPLATFIMNIILFAVMLILALNLLGIFGFSKKLQLRMPKFLSKTIVKKAEASNNYLTPTILGISTFFLPCGFTQSMQFYSLTTGSFITGALTMFTFTLGTFPVLALISFSSVKLAKSLQSGLFFKTAGFIVLFFAIFNFIGALVAIGLIKPIFNI